MEQEDKAKSLQTMSLLEKNSEGSWYLGLFGPMGFSSCNSN